MHNVGTIIELARDGALVMANDCSFVLVKKKKGMFLGQQIQYTDYDIKNTNNSIVKKISVLAGVAAIFLMAFLAVHQFMQSSTLKDTYAFVDVDINPSLEFLIDKNNSVIGSRPINEDAKTLVEDEDFKGMPVEEALLKVLDLAYDQGYIIVDRENVVLVTVALNPDAAKKGDEEHKLEELLKRIELNSGWESNIKTLLITASKEIKKSAGRNGLSIGRQYIYEKSIEQDIKIDMDEVKEGDIEELLEEVKFVIEDLDRTNSEDNSGSATPIPTQEETPGITPTVDPSPTVTLKPSIKPTVTPLPSPTVTPTVKPTITVKPTPTVKPTLTLKPTPTVKPSIKPTPTKVSYEYVKISGKAEGGKIILRWQPLTNSKGFKYYKVVASKSTVGPKYPENGYLYAISDINANSAIVDNSQAYTDGDFGTYFKNGERYYFSVTAVYEDRTVPGDVIVLTYPGQNVGQSSSSSAVKPNVSATVKDGKVYLKWDPIYVDNFTYYKIVISKNNSQPKYPEDGYLYFTTDPNETSLVVDKTMAYNGGDFGKFLESGQKYYFSVTVVYGGNKVPGNVIQLTFP